MSDFHVEIIRPGDGAYCDYLLYDRGNYARPVAILSPSDMRRIVTTYATNDPAGVATAMQRAVENREREAANRSSEHSDNDCEHLAVMGIVAELIDYAEKNGPPSQDIINRLADAFDEYTAPRRTPTGLQTAQPSGTQTGADVS